MYITDLLQSVSTRQDISKINERIFIKFSEGVWSKKESIDFGDDPDFLVDPGMDGSLGRPEPPFLTGLCFTADVFFFYFFATLSPRSLDRSP